MGTLRAVILSATCLFPALFASSARADGCYTCGSGSAARCADYCRYTGSDTFAARKECESRGCKVSGTASCPTAANAKVCLAPVTQDTVVAAAQAAAAEPILWCVAPAVSRSRS